MNRTYLLVAFLAVTSAVSAQTFHGGIRGTVVDASGASFRNGRLAIRAPGAQIEQRRFLFRKSMSQIEPDARSSIRTDAGE